MYLVFIFIAANLQVLVDARAIRSRRQVVNVPLFPDNEPYQAYGLPGASTGGYSPFQVQPNQQEAPPLLFTQVFGFGQQIRPQNRFLFDGELDIPLIDNGYYFPGKVKGNLDVGPSPLDIDYGHAINPVNPFNIKFGELYYCVVKPERCIDPAYVLNNYDLGDPRKDFLEKGLESDRIMVVKATEPPTTTSGGSGGSGASGTFLGPDEGAAKNPAIRIPDSAPQQSGR